MALDHVGDTDSLHPPLKPHQKHICGVYNDSSLYLQRQLLVLSIELRPTATCNFTDTLNFHPIQSTDNGHLQTRISLRLHHTHLGRRRHRRHGNYCILCFLAAVHDDASADGRPSYWRHTLQRDAYPYFLPVPVCAKVFFFSKFIVFLFISREFDASCMPGRLSVMAVSVPSGR